MGFFNTKDQRWKKVRFKRTLIAGYALFIVAVGLLVVRLMNGSARVPGVFPTVPLVIAAAACIAAAIAAAYILRSVHRSKGWSLFDVIYPVSMFAATAIVIVLHILLSPM